MGGQAHDVAAEGQLRQRARDVRLRLLVRLTVLHGVGGLVVFTFTQLRYPASEGFDTPWLNDLLLVVVTMAAMTPVAWGYVAWEFRRSAAWALEGRRPTAIEREQVLTAPIRMAVRPLLLWVAAAAIIGAIVSVRPVWGLREVVDIAQILFMGGLTTSALSYLVVERTYRPLFASALLDRADTRRPRSLGVRSRLLLAWAASSGVPLLGLATIPTRQEVASDATLVTLGVIGLLAGLFGLSIAADSIAVRLDAVRDALDRVRRGDLSEDLHVDDGGEVGEVQAGFNQMVAGLRERRRIQDLFGRHVGHEVAAQAVERGTDLGGESTEASAMFVDLIGSTAMAEVLPPGEVVASLNAYFEAVVDVVTAEGGWVNKFQGDGALCVFGVPARHPDHAARALRAARLLHERIRVVAEQHPGLDAGIGVSTGTVVAGNVGSAERFEYTVIGRAVNEASRLTDLAQRRPARVLASAASVRASGAEAAHWAPRGEVGLRGHQAPTEVFEPLEPPADPLEQAGAEPRRDRR